MYICVLVFLHHLEGYIYLFVFLFCLSVCLFVFLPHLESRLPVDLFNLLPEIPDAGLPAVKLDEVRLFEVIW